MNIRGKKKKNTTSTAFVKGVKLVGDPRLFAHNLKGCIATLCDVISGGEDGGIRPEGYFVMAIFKLGLGLRRWVVLEYFLEIIFIFPYRTFLR